MFLTAHRLLPLLLLLLGALALRSAAANPTENTGTFLNATMSSEIDDDIEWALKEGEDGWPFEGDDLDGDGVLEEDELEWPLGNQSHAGLQKRDDMHRNLHENKLVDCYRNTTCHELRDLTCRAGYTAVGWDQDTCKKFGQKVEKKLRARNICCKTETVKQLEKEGKKCTWRHCNQYGRDGDVMMFRSKVGGMPRNPNPNRRTWNKRCRGDLAHKYFACPLLGFEELKTGCKWSNLCQLESWCKEDEREDARRTCSQKVGLFRRYCCKKAIQPEPLLSNCHWIGKGFCEQTSCNPNEVVFDHNRWGHASTSCFPAGRHRALCCTPEMGRLKAMKEAEKAKKEKEEREKRDAKEKAEREKKEAEERARKAKEKAENERIEREKEEERERNRERALTEIDPVWGMEWR